MNTALKYVLIAICYTLMTAACGPNDPFYDPGWVGNHNPWVGEDCQGHSGELRCSWPPSNSKFVLQCDGARWVVLENYGECTGNSTCNWAGDHEAYCSESKF